MSAHPLLIVSGVAAVSSATVAGLFYAFSTITMRGLDRAHPAEAIAAMRGINDEAQENAPFLVLFFASAVLAVAVGILAVLRLDMPGSWYLLAGALLTLVALIVTVVFNIPLNNRLAALDPTGLSATEAARQWAAYYRPWTAWNHVRTAAPLVGAVLLLIGTRHG